MGALHRCEALAGALYAAQGSLSQAAIEAEQALGLSAVVGQSVLNPMADAQQRTAAVRADLVTAHRRLERLGDRLGIDVGMYGDLGKTPDDPPKTFFTTGADASGDLR